MVATEFEYRHRFWLILLVYAGAYAFYNLDHLNVLYAIVPWNKGVFLEDALVRVLYGMAALLAAAGAALLTWATAYRPTGPGQDRAAFSTGGPFRHVRNPHCLAYFFLLLALGTFQSRVGFPVMLACEIILLLRLAGREETQFETEFGEQYRHYAQSVPALVPSLRPGFKQLGPPPRWRQAIWQQAFQWGFAVTLLAFACTLSDRIGYAFGLATICFLILQKLSQFLWIRLRRTSTIQKK
jgi:protein-S-isoprenylcysteine O-methyltransferase Ste14